MMIWSLKKRGKEKGFTLIEIMVSLSVFIIIMTVSLGSILSILNSSEKSQTKKTAMDNLNFALESMSRTIRFGTNFYCGTTASNPPGANDCASSATSFSVRDSNGALIVYSLSNGKIMKAVNNGTANAVTSGEITITRLTFYVFGSSGWPDLHQPRVIVSLSGIVGTKTATASSFNLETSVSQRKLDI
jgi:prepilin-type N-terminal cleavage/methylation domain-containing protein